MTVKTLIARFETKNPSSTTTNAPTPADYPAQGTVATLASRYEAFIASAGHGTRVVGSAPTSTGSNVVSSIGHDSPVNAVDSDGFVYPATTADDHLVSSIDQDYSLDAIDLDGVFQFQANDALDVEPETTHISAHRTAQESQTRTTAPSSRTASTTTTTAISTRRHRGRNNHAKTPSRVFAYENSTAWTQQRAANQARIQARRLINEQQTRAATIPSRPVASPTSAPPPPAQVETIRSRSMAANGTRRAGRDPYAHIKSRVFDFMKPTAPPQPTAAN
ncbi:hypothetical protein BBJ28_00001882 [Nothophytophthora sp. Chile5]|nr:hypothetical protein BBJ28_00001882 [Nothophytophthora sp. Chile5]